jgi:carbamoyl-phosphate synthase large subunit
MNILVSCAGGPAAVGVIKSLRDINFDGKIVAIDCEPMSVGFYLSDAYHVVPFAIEDDYWKEVLKVIRKEKINLIVPTGDADIVHFSRNKKMLEKLGVISFMSDYDSIRDCQDKLRFYQKSYGDQFPKTSDNWRDISFPILCKPRRGSGSRGVYVWEDESQVRDLTVIDNLHVSKEYIYQEYLPGTEYTIDVFCDLESNPLSILPRERLQTKAGISTKGKIVRNKQIESACATLCSNFKLKGPVCLQMKEDASGIPKFIEANPRLGGGTYFTTLAGVNFMKIMLDIVNGNDIEVKEPKEITVLRYYSEVVI